MNWIDLAREKHGWLALVNAFCFHKLWGVAEESLNFSRSPFHVVSRTSRSKMRVYLQIFAVRRINLP